MRPAHPTSTDPTVSTSLAILFGKDPRRIIVSNPVAGDPASSAAGADDGAAASSVVDAGEGMADAYRKVTFTRASADEPFAVERLTKKQAFHEHVSAAQAESICLILLGEKPDRDHDGDLPDWVRQIEQGRAAFRQLDATGDTLRFEIKVSKKGKVMFSQKRREDLAFLDGARISGQGERYDGKPVSGHDPEPEEKTVARSI